MGQIISHSRENKRLLQTNQLFTLFVQHRCWKATPQLGAISAVTEVMQALHALFLACYISTLSSDSRTLGCARLCSMGTEAHSHLSMAQSSSLLPSCQIWLLGQLFLLSRSFSTVTQNRSFFASQLLSKIVQYHLFPTYSIDKSLLVSSDNTL